MALNRRERELEAALEKAAKALEKFAKNAGRAGGGMGGGAAQGFGGMRGLARRGARGGRGALGGRGMNQFPGGFGQALRGNLAGAMGAKGLSSLAGGPGGLLATGVQKAAEIGQQLATAGINSAARGGSFTAGAALEGDRILSNVPFFGEAAKGRVQATEGTIGDLNALTNNLAALGADTDGLRREAAPILRAQQERIFADQQKNANIAEDQNRDKSALGQMFNGIHDAFGSAGISGAK